MDNTKGHHMDFTAARAFIKDNIARRLNKPAAELVAWKDYDPIVVDEGAHRLVRQSQGTYNNWTGD
jgi:hypothetical protein